MEEDDVAEELVMYELMDIDVESKGRGLAHRADPVLKSLIPLASMLLAAPAGECVMSSCSLSQAAFSTRISCTVRCTPSSQCTCETLAGARRMQLRGLCSSSRMPTRRSCIKHGVWCPVFPPGAGNTGLKPDSIPGNGVERCKQAQHGGDRGKARITKAQKILTMSFMVHSRLQGD